MPDPTDQLNQLDLQGLPPEEAAKLIRAHAQALAQQQRHAMLGMLGDVPEFQKAGEAEYALAGKERGANQELGAQVLKQTLGEKEAQARLMELQNQGLFQRGQLSISLGQLRESERGHKEEERIRDIMTKPTVPSKILEGMSDEEKRLGQLDALKQAIPELGWAWDLARVPAQAALNASKKTVGGYRAMGAQGVPVEAPGTPPAIPTAMGGQPPANKIWVIRKDGMPGRISPQAFDPSKYDMPPPGFVPPKP